METLYSTLNLALFANCFFSTDTDSGKFLGPPSAPVDLVAENLNGRRDVIYLPVHSLVYHNPGVPGDHVLVHVVQLGFSSDIGR